MSGATVVEHHATLTFSDRSDVQVRSTAGLVSSDPTVTGPSADFVTLGTAFLDVSREQWDYSLNLLPMLTLRALGQVTAPNALASGAATFGWHNHRMRIGVRQEFAYGYLDYATAAPPTAPAGTPPAPTTILQAPTILLTEQSRTMLVSNLALSRRTAAFLTAGYQLGGGADTPSRAALPFQQGPVAEARLDYELTRRDHLLTDVEARHADFSQIICPPGTPVAGQFCSPRIELVYATETWRHKLAPRLALNLSGGVALLRFAETPTDNFAPVIYPVVEVEIVDLVHGDGWRADLRLGGRLAPIITQQTGQVEQRIDAGPSAEWTRGRLTLQAAGRFAQSLPLDAPTAYNLVRAGVSASYRVNRTVELSMGDRVDYQSVPAATAPAAGPAAAGSQAAAGPSSPIVSNVSFVRVTVTSSPVHFAF